MKFFFKKHVYIVFFIFFTSFFGACEKQSSVPKNPTVLVSVPPYAFIVKKIAGDTVTIHTIVPPGFNPHIFEPKPSQVLDWSSVNLWICIGELFEKKISPVIKTQNPQLTILDLSSDATISAEDHHCHEHEEEHDHEHREEKDLHFWLSPKIMIAQAEKICESLSTAFPENRSFYQSNLVSLQKELRETDRKISQMMENSVQKSILVSHPAFAYFCRDYHVDQLSIEVEGKDPLPAHITELLLLAQKKSVACVFLQPQYSNKGAEIIANQLNLPSVEIDPYAYEYLSNLELIAEKISQKQ